MGDNDKAQIHIQVDSDEKEQWEQEAADHPEVEHASLSRLVRMAVRKEVRGQYSDSMSGDASVSVDLSSIEEQQAQTEKALVELRNVVDRMDTRLNEVQRDVSASRQKQSLEDRLFHALPPARPHSEPWARAKPTPLPKDRRKWEVAWSGRIEDIAIVARDSETVIEDQLETMPVESGEIEGKTRYWLEE